MFPEWVTNGIVTTKCNTKIFDQDWVTFIKTKGQNQTLMISKEVQDNIQKYVYDSCFRPDDKIALFGDITITKKNVSLVRKNTSK